MTPQERQLVDDLFDRLAKVENAARDPEAAAAISEGLRRAPNAVYVLVQTALLQDEALRRANARIQELEASHAPAQAQSGGFLDSMRETILGPGEPRSSVPNVRPPENPTRPVWNSGQVMQQVPSQGQYGQGQYGQGPYGQPYGAPQVQQGGSFLGTAAAAAAGVVGGSLLLNSIRSMMGGSHQGFGDASAMGDRTAGKGPWGDQSDSNLARDAGVGDIGSSGTRSDDSRAGFFDQASNENYEHDDDADDTGFDSDDFGGDGDTDYA